MPIRQNKVSYTLDVSEYLEDVPEDDREDATFEAGEAALEKITEYMENRKTPVSGVKNFRALSKEYAKIKQKRVGNKNPNLRLTGKLIESLDVESDNKSFSIRVIGKKDTEKAYNHNTGDTVPKRQFLPDDTKRSGPGSKFKRDVVSVIKKTINRYKKPVKKQPVEEVVPTDITATGFADALKNFRVSEREKEIARNMALFKIEDIL